ncbi:MAG: hypothetical protein COZ75_09565 [Flavobacteriaceae bacterium CG_4_8_14_3_um_filter_34_10]|nr:hypothetical protein [Flavobacteriia bacterium]PIQ18036.1 MAG: hypothetical protein COW66_08570 [Flavobacteriaceae bacterium CG18_big_fil_WC_8_21_14_2_50_34_36]PIV50117.1 MAG: hypothetical protein COS19_05100 [Flavobacteriaceae bacterium CG02_land_8_20_14_3_00_34_13]PIX08908.1 MAG: hypothetical protein COZ75_09565 [Flavobacteriaceae bacterium CG_4_8_14_3_um_filter_34_10]
MKNFSMTFIVVFLFILNAIGQNNKREVKIIKIDSTESNYFIRAKFKCKPKGKFMIVSKRDTTVTAQYRIKEKNTYNLELENYLSEKEINRLPVKKPGTLKLREDGFIIWDGKSNLPLKSPNIKSIFYKDN